MEKLTQTSTVDNLPGVDAVSQAPIVDEAVEAVETINTKPDDGDASQPVDSEVIDNRNQRQIETKREINKIRQELGMDLVPEDEPVRSSDYTHHGDRSFGVFNVGEYSRLKKEEERLKREQEETEEVTVKTVDEIETPAEVESNQGNSNEEWKEAANERFGIKDFDLEVFRRKKFVDETLVRSTMASGKDYRYIVDNPEIFKTRDSYDEAINAFKLMQELEVEIPGSVRFLHEELGITNFQRYPKELLVDQLMEPDPNKALAVMAFAESDWNGAFDDQQDIWKYVLDQQRDKYNFRVFESGTAFSLARQLLRARNDFGKGVSELFLSAHGDEGGLYLGDDFKEVDVGSQGIEDFQTRFDGVILDDAQLLANSCSAGAANGWLQKLTKSSRIKAMGPDKPAVLGGLTMVEGNIVPVYREEEALSNYYRGFQFSKKKSTA